MTGQPEDSPGFSTMGMNGGRIISRRVNLRADHPNLRQGGPAARDHPRRPGRPLPDQQIPRWADEGMAVLSEPADEQQRRAADLDEPLAANRLFPVDDLMSMDYPDGQLLGPLLRPERLADPVPRRAGDARPVHPVRPGLAARTGYEAELRRVYRIDGFADLQAAGSPTPGARPTDADRHGRPTARRPTAATCKVR